MTIWKLLIVYPYPRSAKDEHVFIGRDYREEGEARLAGSILKTVLTSCLVTVESADAPAEYFESIPKAS